MSDFFYILSILTYYHEGKYFCNVCQHCNTKKCWKSTFFPFQVRIFENTNTNFYRKCILLLGSVCCNCGANFKNAMQLKQHIDVVHPNSSFLQYVNICGYMDNLQATYSSVFYPINQPQTRSQISTPMPQNPISMPQNPTPMPHNTPIRVVTNGMLHARFWISRKTRETFEISFL